MKQYPVFKTFCNRHQELSDQCSVKCTKINTYFLGECCLEGCHRFAPAWKTEGWRKQIGKAMARKWGEEPQKKNM